MPMRLLLAALVAVSMMGLATDAFARKPKPGWSPASGPHFFLTQCQRQPGSPAC